MATAKYDGDIIALFRRAGGKLAIVLGCADILCIGPFLAIPRTGATTYEMGIMPIIALFRRAGGKLAIVLGCADILCIGPFLAIPRTGATTYEMGIMPLLGNTIPIAVFAAIFFIITYVLTIKPSKVVDIVGRVLTPALQIFFV